MSWMNGACESHDDMVCLVQIDVVQLQNLMF